MKKCPWCAEEIQDEAIKCRFCGEFLASPKPATTPSEKWYYKTSWLIVSFLAIGPLALPFLWLNPRLSKKKKIIISAIVLAASVFVTILVSKSLKSLFGYYQQLFDLLDRTGK